MSSPSLTPAAPAGKAVLALAYVGVFVLFDWVSFIRPLQGMNITPWNPQPALAIALLLHRPRWWLLVWTGLLTAELVVRGWPDDSFTVLTATTVLGLCYAALARALQQHLVLARPLSSSRELLRFAVITTAGALVSGVLYVSCFALAPQGLVGSFIEAVLRYWVGDAVGLIVMLPMLLLLSVPTRRRELMHAARSGPGTLLVVTIVLLAWAVFLRDQQDHFRFFYLLLLPVVWAAGRLGLAGAVLAAGLTQIGLIVAVQSVPNQDLTVFELQVLMAALTVTGLALGVAVDERERAAADLKGSLRLAAAGQMSAALAHELSQPLTALASWAESARLIEAMPGLPPAQRLARLSEVSQRMAADAQRAGEVVKRLREFFRSGSTQLKRIDPQGLVAEALQAQARRADILHIALVTDAQMPGPELLVDPVQVAVVLRNLLANAIDAASSAGGPGQVLLRLRQVDDRLRLDVIDSGPGVDPSRLLALFDPGSSDKPGGMGVGLSICRAIVEAHGGQLWAEPGARGHFCLTLPLAPEPTFHDDPAP